MAPPFLPEGEPVSKGRMDNGEMEWADYADKTRVQTKKDGAVHYTYKEASHGIQQYSEMPDGTEITYYVDGRRRQKFSNGTVLEVAIDKTRVQTNPDGVSIETHTNGHTLQRNPNGSTLETHADNELLEIDFPLGVSPCETKLSWPLIKSVQTSINATHYIGADGTDVQVSSNGDKIVRWVAGHCTEADSHYAQTGQQWCMQVDSQGDTNFLVKDGVNTDVSTGQQQTSWTLDPYWDIAKTERENTAAAAAAAAAADAAAEKAKIAAAAAAEKAEIDKARSLLKDPSASAKDLKAASDRMRQIKGNPEASSLAADLDREGTERQMDEDLRRVWSEQTQDRLTTWSKMTDTSKDPAALRAEADHARKVALSSGKDYNGVHQAALDDMAKMLDQAAQDLEKPDPTKLAAIEACERFRQLMEDEDVLPDDLLAAADEAEALANSLGGKSSYAKEQRDAEQFAPQLRAKAVQQEKEIKRLVANKFKLYPYMKWKNFLKKNGVDKKEVDAVLDKYTLWQLSKRKGIVLPNNPLDL